MRYAGKKRKNRGPWAAVLWSDRVSAQAELLVEAADTSAGIHHLLLTGVEGVTLGADFHLDVLPGRASLDHVAAGARNGGLLILGMDAFLHRDSPLSVDTKSPGAQKLLVNANRMISRPPENCKDFFQIPQSFSPRFTAPPHGLR